MLDFKSVWSLYNHHYHPDRLYPGVTPPKKGAQPIDSLLSIVDQFDILLLDGFGVLNVGESAIPHMPEEIAHLQRLGVECFVLTNGASYPSSVRAKIYPKLGYSIEEPYIISSRDAVEVGVAQHPLTEEGGLWGVIVTDGAYIETIPANCCYLTRDNIDEVDGFIFLGTAYWDQEWQEALRSSLTRRLRPLLVGNPDVSAPFERGFSVEPGYYAFDLKKSIPELELSFYGKPFQNAYEVSIQKIERQLRRVVDPQRILMVGDTLHTDILGGNMAGMKSALKADWGFLRGQDPYPYIKESGITPDFIITKEG